MADPKVPDFATAMKFPFIDIAVAAVDPRPPPADPALLMLIAFVLLFAATVTISDVDPVKLLIAIDGAAGFIKLPKLEPYPKNLDAETTPAVDTWNSEPGPIVADPPVIVLDDKLVEVIVPPLIEAALILTAFNDPAVMEPRFAVMAESEPTLREDQYGILHDV